MRPIARGRRGILISAGCIGQHKPMIYGNFKRLRVQLRRIRLHPRFESLAAIKYAIPASAFDCQSICDALCERPLIVVEAGPGSYYSIGNTRDYSLARARLGDTAFVPVRVAVDNSPDAIEGYYTAARFTVFKHALGDGGYVVLGELHQTLPEKFYHRVFAKKYSKSAFTKLLGKAFDTLYCATRRGSTGEAEASDDARRPGLDYSKLVGERKE